MRQEHFSRISALAVAVFLLLGLGPGLTGPVAAEPSGLYLSYKNYYYDEPAICGQQAEITAQLTAGAQAYYVFRDEGHYLPVDTVGTFNILLNAVAAGTDPATTSLYQGCLKLRDAGNPANPLNPLQPVYFCRANRNPVFTNPVAAVAGTGLSEVVLSLCQERDYLNPRDFTAVNVVNRRQIQGHRLEKAGTLAAVYFRRSLEYNTRYQLYYKNVFTGVILDVPDPNNPALISGVVADNTGTVLRVDFDSPLTTVSPQDFAVYLQTDLESFDPAYFPALQVLEARLAADGMAVYLVTTPQDRDTKYTLRYKNNARCNFTGAGTPAVITAAEPLDSNIVRVTFDRMVERVDPADFSIVPSLGLVSPSLDAGNRSATLLLEKAMTAGTPYLLVYNQGGSTAPFTGKGPALQLTGARAETGQTLRVTFSIPPDFAALRPADFAVVPYLTIRNIQPTGDPRSVLLVTGRQNTGLYQLTYRPGSPTPVAFHGSGTVPVLVTNLAKTPVLGRFTFNTDQPVTATDLSGCLTPVALDPLSTGGAGTLVAADITVNFTTGAGAGGMAWTGEIVPQPAGLPCRYTFRSVAPFLLPEAAELWWDGIAIKSLVPVDSRNPAQGVRLLLEANQPVNAYQPVTAAVVQRGITLAGVGLTWLQADAAGLEYRTRIPGAVAGRTYTFDVGNSFFLNRGVEPIVQWLADAAQPVEIISLEAFRDPVTNDFRLALKTDRPVLSASLNGFVTLREWNHPDISPWGPLWSAGNSATDMHYFTEPADQTFIVPGRPYTFDLAGPFFIRDSRMLTVVWE